MASSILPSSRKRAFKLKNLNPIRMIALTSRKVDKALGRESLHGPPAVEKTGYVFASFPRFNVPAPKERGQN